jgi:acyl-CoA reductase-like NAD-dependent aldehyde dehydrogenase
MAVTTQTRVKVLAPFIDGKTVDPHGDETTEVLDPSNGRPLLRIPTGSTEDADRAVTSARRAFESGVWSDAAPSFRKKVLFRLAELITAEADAFDALDASEMGKPVREPLYNAAMSAGLLRFFAEAVDKVNGDVFPSDAKSLVVQRRVPRGVVAAITPWNFPTANALIKIAPALAAGNTVVHKPSEMSTQSALRIAQLAIEAGLPPGVLNVVPGLGEVVGQALALHMDVDMAAFTGSSEVGKLILQFAGRSNMKRVLLECGGKSPVIVFADGVDLAAASQAVADRLLINQGQVCSVGSRLLVQRDAEDEVLERVTTRLRQVRMGDPRDRETTFGPLASPQQLSRVTRYIDSGGADGAKLVAGGHRALSESGGFFVEPTVFRDVPPSARIAQEEIFGPVLSVMPFADEDEAIRIANNTTYGLTGFVWTRDLSRAMRVAKAIRSSVRVNAAPAAGEGAGFAASGEPIRQSGFGVEFGLGGMESYLRRQTIAFVHS